MADLPTSFGSGKPTLSRVPEGGGGAFRPRPVPGVAKGPAVVVPSSVRQPPADAQPKAVAEPVPQDSVSDDSALWARLAGVNARRQALKDRAAKWSKEGVGTDG